MRIDNEKRERQEWEMREILSTDMEWIREILSTDIDLESLCIPNGRKNPNRFYYLDRE